MVKVAEEWLESAAEKPQWIRARSSSGLGYVIDELDTAKDKAIKSKNPFVSNGAVIYGYAACENILRQSFSFYGRFIYGSVGKSYRDKALNQYDADAFQYAPERWAQMLPDLENEYEQINEQTELASSEDREIQLKQFVGYILSKKWPMNYSTLPSARDLRKWKGKGPNFGFASWIELLRQLNEWILLKKNQ